LISPAGKPLGVGLVGYAFMGAAHSQAWRSAGRFFDLPLEPRLAVLCGRNEIAVAEAATRMGWAATETDWQKLIARDDVDLVDICTPGDSHAEIAIAALQAGKHVFCEKPLANTVAAAAAMAAVAERASERGVRSMVGFNYRRVPALALARRMIAAGRLGTLRQVRAVYLQDWISDPQFPLVWRLQKDKAGSGALGDIGSHIVDLSQYLVADHLTQVAGFTETFVKQRPVSAASSGLSATGGETLGDVTVDDAALFHGRFAGGVVASFEATRLATGRKNAMRIEVNGSRGSLAFDFESMNELSFYDGTEDSETAGFRRILVTEPSHPYVGAWWPPGHLLGYEHSFTHEVVDLVNDIAAGVDPSPSFADGLQVQRVLAAVEASANADSAWREV
jgi:predicted dehydrogenase